MSLMSILSFGRRIMARKTIDVATVIEMGNKVTASSDFRSYEREIVCAVIESIIQKSGNKVDFTSLSEDPEEYKREYKL